MAPQCHPCSQKQLDCQRFAGYGACRECLFAQHVCSWKSTTDYEPAQDADTAFSIPELDLESPRLDTTHGGNLPSPVEGRRQVQDNDLGRYRSPYVGFLVGEGNLRSAATEATFSPAMLLAACGNDESAMSSPERRCSISLTESSAFRCNSLTRTDTEREPNMELEAPTVPHQRTDSLSCGSICRPTSTAEISLGNNSRGYSNTGDTFLQSPPPPGLATLLETSRDQFSSPVHGETFGTPAIKQGTCKRKRLKTVSPSGSSKSVKDPGSTAFADSNQESAVAAAGGQSKLPSYASPSPYAPGSIASAKRIYSAPEFTLQSAIHSTGHSQYLAGTVVHSMLKALCPNPSHYCVVDPAHMSIAVNHEYDAERNVSPRRYRPLRASHRVLIIPIHLQEAQHWMLAIANLQERSVQVFDPCHCQALIEQATKHLCVFLKSVDTRLKEICGVDTSRNTEWDFSTQSAIILRQQNSHDCGVYIIAAAAFVMHSQEVPGDLVPDVWRRACAAAVNGASHEVEVHERPMTGLHSYAADHSDEVVYRHVVRNMNEAEMILRFLSTAAASLDEACSFADRAYSELRSAAQDILAKDEELQLNTLEEPEMVVQGFTRLCQGLIRHTRPPSRQSSQRYRALQSAIEAMKAEIIECREMEKEVRPRYTHLVKSKVKQAEKDMIEQQRKLDDLLAEKNRLELLYE